MNQSRDLNITGGLLIALAAAFMLIAWGSMIPLGPFAFVGFMTTACLMFALGWTGGAQREAERRTTSEHRRCNPAPPPKHQPFVVFTKDDAERAQAISDVTHDLDIYG